MTDPFKPARLDRLDRRLSGWVEKGKYAGMEWMLGDASGPIHQGRAGVRSAEQPEQGLPDAPIYRIYSMTKPMVSLVAMQLVEEGALHLWRPIETYLPEYADMQVFRPDGLTEPARSSITAQQLLNHSSGLSYGFLAGQSAMLYARAEAKAGPGLPLREQVKLWADIPLAFHPGTDWGYSTATCVLAAICEIVGEDTIQNLVRDRITAPLGMEETGYAIPAGAEDRLMQMYGGKPGALNPLDLSAAYPHSDPGWGRGGHGMFSTLSDYGKFARALLNLATGAAEGPVSRETLRMMTADLTPEGAHPLSIDLPAARSGPGLGGYGFGLGFRTCLPHQGGFRLRRILALPGEFGWSGAAETWFSVAPEQGVWAVFMSQNLDWPGASADFQTMMVSALR